MLYKYNMSTGDQIDARTGVRSGEPGVEEADDALFRALAHRTRRRLLDVLKSGPRTTGMLCDALPELDRCTVMQHLKVLEQAGLIAVERRGRERWNHLDALPIHAIHERWIGPYAAHAAALLSRLRRATELGDGPVEGEAGATDSAGGGEK
jgi:DNA-binding transcriptional ArsR family regulator